MDSVYGDRYPNNLIGASRDGLERFYWWVCRVGLPVTIKLATGVCRHSKLHPLSSIYHVAS